MLPIAPPATAPQAATISRRSAGTLRRNQTSNTTAIAETSRKNGTRNATARPARSPNAAPVLRT